MQFSSRNCFQISLDKLEKNFVNISKLVSPSKVAVAIKANAYGHGFIPVAKILENLGVEFLCVATPDEAIELRKNQIKTKILLLSEPGIGDLEQFSDLKVSLSVYSRDFLRRIASVKRDFNVHLKINTGMNRVGCRIENVSELADIISLASNLKLEGIYTHFPSADDQVKDETLGQLKTFEYELEQLKSRGLNPDYVHSANSAAAISIPGSRFDLVRVGLSIYGYYPSLDMKQFLDLEPIADLYSEISYIHRINAGEGVSYSSLFRTPKDTNIAVVPIGYADGVPRNLGIKGGNVLIEDKFYPIVGAVTMDQLMVDLGDDEYQVGTKVVLFGKSKEKQISADDWAMATDTISYEILCGIGPRVQRIYV